MKILFKIVLITLVLTSIDCSRKDEPTSPRQNTEPPGHVQIEKGKIMVEFVDTLSQAQAESFLLARGLPSYTLYNFNQQPPHTAIIGVPVGQEQLWVDILREYPEIKIAGLIGVIYENT